MSKATDNILFEKYYCPKLSQNKSPMAESHGILKSHGAIPYIKEKLTNIDLIELENQTKLIQRLATEKLDAVIENPFIMYYFAQINQIDNIRLWDYIEMDEEQQGKTSMHIGVRYDLPILHQILVKAFDAVSDEEMLQIKKKWTDISIVRIDWTPVAQILGVIALVVIFLLWNNKVLKSMVSAKTKELKELNETLESKVKERTKNLNGKYSANPFFQKNIKKVRDTLELICYKEKHAICFSKTIAIIHPRDQ